MTATTNPKDTTTAFLLLSTVELFYPEMSPHSLNMCQNIFLIYIKKIEFHNNSLQDKNSKSKTIIQGEHIKMLAYNATTNTQICRMFLLCYNLCTVFSKIKKLMCS